MRAIRNYDSLYLYVLDQLSCPVMAAECERVFSAAKVILSPERNALSPKIIEACECLRWWWRTDVISGASPAFLRREPRSRPDVMPSLPRTHR